MRTLARIHHQLDKQSKFVDKLVCYNTQSLTLERPTWILSIEQHSVGHRIEGSHEISNVFKMVREIEGIKYTARQVVKRKAVIMLVMFAVQNCLIRTTGEVYKAHHVRRDVWKQMIQPQHW
jgi:hypothetical protein